MAAPPTTPSEGVRRRGGCTQWGRTGNGGRDRRPFLSFLRGSMRDRGGAAPDGRAHATPPPARRRTRRSRDPDEIRHRPDAVPAQRPHTRPAPPSSASDFTGGQREHGCGSRPPRFFRDCFPSGPERPAVEIVLAKPQHSCSYLTSSVYFVSLSVYSVMNKYLPT